MLVQKPVRRFQVGFTLIELIIVIVIIGILAAVAIPKYIDITGEAKIAAVAGLAGNVASGAATNFALCAAYPTAAAGKCTGPTACGETTGWAVLQGGKPSGAVMSGNDAACIITKDSVASPPFAYSATAAPT